MKKKISVLLAVCLIGVSVCACGGVQPADSKVSSESAAAVETEQTEKETVEVSEETEASEKAELTEEAAPESTEKTTPKPTKEPTPEPTEEPTPEPTEVPKHEPTKQDIENDLQGNWSIVDGMVSFDNGTILITREGKSLNGTYKVNMAESCIDGEFILGESMMTIHLPYSYESGELEMFNNNGEKMKKE